MLSVTNAILEYIPIPAVSCTGFVMAILLSSVIKTDSNEEDNGFLCAITKYDKWETMFEEQFLMSTNESFRKVFPYLQNYCGAELKYCKHARSHVNEEEFEYIVFPDMKSFRLGKEWLDSRWLINKLD